MKILIIDDEEMALKDLMSILQQVIPYSEIYPCHSYQEALTIIKTTSIDIAFLDIEIGEKNGIVLAKEMKDLQTDIHIIFVTAYAKYAMDAFAVHANGYLLKPVQKEDIQRELTFAYQVIAHTRIRVQTFGGFEIFVDGKPLIFKRSKAKELLAYLVDRRGIGVTTRQACSILWEDEPYDVKLKNYYQVILMELRNTLKKAGIEDIIRRHRNFIAIDPNKIDCDYYRFIEGDAWAINTYRRDYMICYSWAEFSMGVLDEQIDNMNDQKNDGEEGVCLKKIIL
ncbi:response regulator [Candidatus Stoquefichus sp. SB1]|uniref:response regulator n=1 Tax=Candidatus Stoquefichus sp. SB1 TaxID=1658109 RepID=UPI0009E24E9B|nr:response regulator [Candidatus Stoquefichus sp. SB1]